ncbi:MAG TPA: MATE family efflux transporter [Candidatus Avidesulfovibrio excrementigallinarum]|nr:MATE family efflux transporter [Candidatus Avidesulfovibrio excrementigallinarum]
MRFLTRDKTFYTALVTLAIPVVLQNLVAFAVNFTDNLMVSSLGDGAVSGVYVGNQLHMLIQIFANGLGGVVLVLAAQYWGRGDVRSIRRITAIGVQLAVLLGLAAGLACRAFPAGIVGLLAPGDEVVASGAAYLSIVCLSYPFFCLSQALIAALRSVESPHVGLWVSLLGFLVNVSLNWLLIFGHGGFPALGVRGAAMATLIARVTECAVLLVYLFRFDGKLGLRPAALFVTDRTLFGDFVRCGIPMICGQIVWGLNTMSNTAILGRYPASVITAASLTNTMNTLAYIIMMGMASAVGIITGKTVGAGKTELMKEYARTTQLLFLTLGVMTGLGVWLLRDPFIALYGGITPEAAACARQLIGVLSVTVVGSCYEVACLDGLVKAGGDVSFVFKNNTFFVLCVVLPSAIVAASLHMPAWIVFACLKCDQILKCFVAVVKINRFNWMKNLTRDMPDAPDTPEHGGVPPR